MKRFILLVLSTFVLSNNPVLAGEKVTLRFLAESVSDDLGEVVCITAGEESPAFKLQIDHLSEVIAVSERLIGLQTKEGKRRLAKIELPATGNQFVVMLLPEAEGTLKPWVIDANLRSINPGDMYLFNHTDRKISGHLGATKFELAPSSGKSLRPSGDFSAGSYNVEFKVSEDTGDRLLRTMRWPVQTRSRAYGFFFRNLKKDRIEFRAVDEFVAPRESGSRKP